MWPKKELIKKQKLTILVIVTVIFALIFLGGSQALSKRPPWRPNYCADVVGDEIEGYGEVKMERWSFSSGWGDNFFLHFYPIDEAWQVFEGDHWGWISVGMDKRTGKGNFYYGWSEDDINYSLTGEGTFEYNKQEGWFEFLSEGEYHITEWSPSGTPEVWRKKLIFQINSTPLDQCGDSDCLCF